MQEDRPDVENCEKIYKCVFFFFVLFFLWLHPFILSGVISPLISSSILGTYQPGEFLFQCPIILPSHTVHGVLKARILKCFAIPFSSGPHSVRPLHHDPTSLGWPHTEWLSFIELDKSTQKNCTKKIFMAQIITMV